MEIITRQKRFLVEMSCPECPIGKMISSGHINGPQHLIYEHVCSECSHVDHYSDIYPSHTDGIDGEEQFQSEADILRSALKAIIYYIEEGGNGFEYTCKRVAKRALNHFAKKNNKDD